MLGPVDGTKPARIAPRWKCIQAGRPDHLPERSLHLPVPLTGHDHLIMMIHETASTYLENGKGARMTMGRLRLRARRILEQNRSQFVAILTRDWIIITQEREQGQHNLLGQALTMALVLAQNIQQAVHGCR